VRLHTGTSEVLGELVLLDHEALEPGQEGLVQLRLSEPVVCAPGDRFVVRLASPAWTLGGGVILEESKHRLKRFKPFVVEELTRASQSLSSPRDLLDVTLARAQGGAHTAEQLAIEIKRNRTETERLLNDLKGQSRAARIGTGQRWIHVERLQRAKDKIAAAITGWFAEHAHREVVDVRDLRRLVGMEPEFLDAVLSELDKEGALKVEAGGLVRPRRQARARDDATGVLAASVKSALDAGRFQPPSPAELAATTGRGAKEVQSALELLVDRGEAHAIQKGEIYLGHDAWSFAKDAIVRNCEKNRSLDIPSLRDELATTRKFLIPLLEHFDAAGLTIRQGGNRVLKRR
jgi:selenocysteine-specific elongation factor